MAKKNPILFLVIITIVSAIIRFYQLGSIPNGLATDEADIGYNAFSILQTGADVYGRKFPLFFQSLDDYKPGLVFYLTIPAVKAFGLNDFSVRLAPAIFGIFTPALAFLLIKLLYPAKKSSLPYLTAILISFAPWNIALSRAMIQYIPLIFLYLIFFILFLFSKNKTTKVQIKTIALPSSFLVLSLTLYVYYAAFIYLPFIMTALVLIYRDFITKNLKIFLAALLLLAICSAPAISHYSEKKSQTRLNAISVLTADVTLPISLAEIEQDKQQGLRFSQITHNRRLVYASAVLDNYLDYFNLDYLFINAKNVRYFYVHSVGLFYLLELPFFLYGLHILAKRREKSDLLIIALLLIGPIPAAITLGSPFPHRALLVPLATQLISAVGLAAFLQKFQLKSPLVLVMATFYAISIYFFLHQYFIHAPREFILGGWFPLIRDTIPKVNSYKPNYDKVVFTWYENRQVPPVYFLFYNKIDPRIIQEKAAKWENEPPSYKQIYNKIGNIEFRHINWETDSKLKNTLFVGYPEEFPPDVKNVVNKTYLPNGQIHLIFVEVKKD